MVVNQSSLTTLIRKSKRLLLIHFLDCVDRRDTHSAASLLHPDALWSTASHFGDITGVSNIKALLSTQLPPRKYGPEYARHRMESAADIDDLTVLTPTGERCQFDIELASILDVSQTKMAIGKLVTEII